LNKTNDYTDKPFQNLQSK